jgi:hypothetical protein
LIWLHKHLKELHHVKPIVSPPFMVLFQSIVEIEAIHINYNSLFFNWFSKNQAHLFRVGRP